MLRDVLWNGKVSFDVDVVYTWVNHNDPEWTALYTQARVEANLAPDTHASVDNLARFQNRDEIVYSVASVKKYAPWVRKIFVVTNCALPFELTSDPKIQAVSHEEVFPDPSVLPSFNSRAIESNLHHIPDVSERILYFNDDFFLCSPMEPSDFFSRDGKAYIFPSRHDIPYGVTKGLRPIDFGALNACELLIRDYGYTPQKKLHHSPFPLLKTNLVELEEQYAPLFQSTRTHKFRNNSDIPPATTLQAYYSLVKGRGEFRCIRSRYIDIGDPLFLLLIHPLSPLRRGKYQTLCLNEVTHPRFLAGFRDTIVQKLLETMFGE